MPRYQSANTLQHSGFNRECACADCVALRYKMWREAPDLGSGDGV